MKNSIFRQKSLDKVSSPEKLDDYIKVTSPDKWLTVIAFLLLLAGAAVWGIFGEQEIPEPDGTAETSAPISFFLN